MEAVIQQKIQTSSFGKWILVGTVLTCAIMELIDSTAVSVARADMMGSLGATSVEIAWVVTAYALGNVITVPLSAMLSDRFGRKLYFTTSVLLFTIASLMCGLSIGLWIITSWRFIQGLAGGALLSTAQSIIGDAFPPKEIATATAIFGMGMMVGPAIGPVVGGYITDNISWHWIFFINVPIGIAGAILCWKYVPDLVIEKKDQKLDWIGIVFMIIGLCSLQYFLEEGMQKNWFDSTEITICFFASVLGIAAFIWRELGIDYPAVKIKLYKNRNLAIGHFMNLILGMLLIGLSFIFPLFVQITLGWTATHQGLFLIFPALASIVAMMFVSKVVLKKISYRMSAIMGIILFAVFLIMLSSSSPDSSEKTFLWPFIINSFGKAMLTVPLMSMALMGLRGQDLAQATGLSNIMRQLGAAIGIALLNIYIEHQNAFVRNDMITHISEYNSISADRITSYRSMFESMGYSPEDALSVAYRLIEKSINTQMQLVSYDNVYMVLGIIMLLCIPLILLIKSPQRKTDSL